MHEYMDKKNLLCKPSERQRLLEEVPQVIPDMKDSEDTESQVPTEDKSIQNNAVDFQVGADADFSVGTNEGINMLKKCSEEKSKAIKEDADGGIVGMDVQKQDTEVFLPVVNTEVNAARELPCAPTQASKATRAVTKGGTSAVHVPRHSAEAVDASMGTQVIIDLEVDENLSERGGQTPIIDLEAVDARDTHRVQQHDTNNTIRTKGISLRKCLWYYIDPQGDEQGPFTMEHLRHWWDREYFPDDFKVWRKGQSSDSAVFLRDVL